ncbi:omptin family outer membrane protease [Pantoea ananatis]
MRPYADMSCCYRYRDFEFNTLLKFSPWIEVRDNDEHYLHHFTFR